MGLFEPRDAAGTLADILEREHRALMQGRFDLLQGLLPEKERALGALGQVRDRATLARLRSSFERNQALLQAAAQGIRTAREVIARTRRAPQGEALVTYDRNGRRTDMTVPGPRTERRA